MSVAVNIKEFIDKSDIGEPYASLYEFTLCDIFNIEKILQGRQITFRKRINIDRQFPKLIRFIGRKKVAKLVCVFEKETIYFPKIKDSCKKKIRKLILEEFNGYNFSELSIKYGYTERHIRNICSMENLK